MIDAHVARTSCGGANELCQQQFLLLPVSRIRGESLDNATQDMQFSQQNKRSTKPPASSASQDIRTQPNENFGRGGGGARKSWTAAPCAIRSIG